MARMTAAERHDRDQRAMELRRAGVPVPKIQSELGFRSSKEVEDALRRALAGVLRDPVSMRELELDRLDRLQQAVWLKAVKGDAAAIDRVIRLAEMRIGLAGVPSGEAQMVAQYDEAVSHLPVTPVDGALVAAGRRIAERIDQAFATGDPHAETKALYLVPHLMNVLRELGATPEARRALKGGESVKSAKLTALRGGASA